MALQWTEVILTLLVTGLINDRLWAEAHPNGLDINSACTSMIPNHGTPNQFSPPPFSIKFSSNSYVPENPVSVTIEACASTAFRGFLIQARRATKGSDQNEALGSFTPVAGTQTTCQGKGLIHTDNSEKQTLTFNWNPPSIAQGHVQFRVTFVHEKIKFWLAVKSAVLPDGSLGTPDSSSLTPASTLASECSGSSSPVTDEPTEATDPPPSTKGTDAPMAGHFVKDPDCDENTNCHSDCGQDGCTFQVKFRQDGADFGEYSIKTKAVGTSDMYAAVGFSSDKKMGRDSVSGCIYQSGTTKPFNAFTTLQVKPEMLEPDGTSVKSSLYENGIFSCTFKRPIAVGLDGQRYDLSLSWYQLFARGQYDNSLGYHDANKQASSQRYSLTGSGQPGVALPEATDPPVIGAVERPPGCGTSKGCISKCSGSSCETVISWEDDGKDVLYTLSSVVSSPSFLAIGFSSDDKMGGDSVSGCATGADNSIKIFNGVNGNRQPPVQFEDPDVTLKSSSLNGNILTCTIKRLKMASTDDKRFNVTKKWFILFARGSSTIVGQTVGLTFHGNNFFVSSEKFSSDDMPNAGSKDIDYPYVKAHGSLMIAAWVFLASIGIVTARYYKPVWKVDLCSQKVWFQIHRTCMILVFCSTAAGFVLIFLEVEGWSDLMEDHAYLETHPILGVIVTALTVLNPTMALFRPHPGTSNRYIFNWAHWIVGTAAHILGVITIFFGVQLRKAQAPDYMVYILAGYVAWQVLITFILELIQCYGHELARREVYEIDDLQKQNAPTVKETTKTSAIKRILLLVHIFVLTAVSGILIGFICIGEENLDH